LVDVFHHRQDIVLYFNMLFWDRLS